MRKAAESHHTQGCLRRGKRMAVLHGPGIVEVRRIGSSALKLCTPPLISVIYTILKN